MINESIEKIKIKNRNDEGALFNKSISHCFGI